MDENGYSGASVQLHERSTGLTTAIRAVRPQRWPGAKPAYLFLLPCVGAVLLEKPTASPPCTCCNDWNDLKRQGRQALCDTW